MNSKLYNLFLILFIIYMLTPLTAQAQEYRYRVEVLVLTHLQHSAEPREFHKLDNYSEAIDYLTPPPPPEEGSEEDQAEAELTEETAGDGSPADADLPGEAPLDSEEPAEPEEIPRVIHIEEMSELMKENWRRLRLSAPFRPLQFLAWEQSADEPFPALRLHDLEVVLVEDPWAEERKALEEQALAEAEAALLDQADPSINSTVVEADEATEATDGEEEEPGLPDPYVFYQLDGTVTLRRSRFLHLDVRLDWREPVFSEESLDEEGVSDADFSSLLPSYPAQPSSTDSPSGDEDEAAPLPVPDSFLVHRLEQSRLVRTDRLEYFDHPVLGVLAHITRFEVEEDESAAE